MWQENGKHGDIIKRGAFHGFSGQVGNLVGGKWKGTNYMRLKAESVTDAKTEDQVAQRLRFKGMIRFAQSVLYNVIQPVWNKDAEGMSGFNLFVKKNMDAFDSEGNIIDYGLLELSTGKLDSAEIAMEATDGVAGSVTVTWNNNSDEPNASEDDSLRLIAIKEGVKPVLLKEKFARTEGSATFAIPFEAGDTVHLYAFFEDVKARRFSKDSYQSVVLG